MAHVAYNKKSKEIPFFSHLILPLYVRRKAKKCPSFPLDFTSICEEESKKISFFPT
jgi:hypothetical protein